MAHTYDAIIIGTGQAGPSLAAELSAAGMSTAIIERHRFGGTCVNVGCIPTKALVASARAAHVARRAADFGVVIGGDVGVDMARVKARKDAIVRRSATGVERWLKSLANCTVYQGHGRFAGDHRVQVGDEVLEAQRIFINVGARAFVPPFPGVEEVDYLTNSTIMELDALPEHLVIVGGGYIGMEFAQMFRRFGSEVTLIDRGDRLIKRESADVSAAVAAILEGEGVRSSDWVPSASASSAAERGWRPPWSAVTRSRRWSGRTCCWRWGGVPTPTTWGWRRPASR